MTDPCLCGDPDCPKCYPDWCAGWDPDEEYDIRKQQDIDDEKQQNVEEAMSDLFRETLIDIGGGLKKAWDDETAFMRRQAD